MDIRAVMELMPRMGEFAEQAKTLIKAGRELTEAVDAFSDYDDATEEGEALYDRVIRSNNAFKLALSNLPKLPNVIEG